MSKQNSRSKVAPSHFTYYRGSAPSSLPNISAFPIFDWKGQSYKLRRLSIIRGFYRGITPIVSKVASSHFTEVPNDKSILNISFKKKLAVTPYKYEKNSLFTKTNFFYPNYSNLNYHNLVLTQKNVSKNYKKEIITKFYGIVRNQIYKSQKNRSNNYFLSYSNKINNVSKNSFLFSLSLMKGGYGIREDKKSYTFNSTKSNHLGSFTSAFPYWQIQGKRDWKTDTLYFVVFFFFMKKKNTTKYSKPNENFLFYCLKSPKKIFECLEPNYETDLSPTNLAFRSGRSVFSAMQTFSESLALGSERNIFFQQTCLSNLVSPVGDTKYKLCYEPPSPYKGVYNKLCLGNTDILDSEFKSALKPKGNFSSLEPLPVERRLNDNKNKIQCFAFTSSPCKGISYSSSKAPTFPFSLTKTILFFAQTERLNLKTLSYFQKYSNTLSSSIFCPNQIKSILMLRQKNIVSALNRIGTNRKAPLVSEGLPWNSYKNFKKVLDKKRKSGIKQHKIYPYFSLGPFSPPPFGGGIKLIPPPKGGGLVGEKQIAFQAFRMSPTLIHFLFLFFFLKVIYTLFYNFPLSRGSYAFPSSAFPFQALKSFPFPSSARKGIIHSYYVGPHNKNVIRERHNLGALPLSLEKGKKVNVNLLSFFDPYVPLTMLGVYTKDFLFLRRGLRFYNNLCFQNLSEHALQYKITSSFLLPLGNTHLRLEAKNSMNQKKQKINMLPKILYDPFFSLNGFFLDYLLSIIHFKQSVYFSKLFSGQSPLNYLGLPNQRLGREKCGQSPLNNLCLSLMKGGLEPPFIRERHSLEREISLTKKDLYSNLNKTYIKLFHSNRIELIQKKDFFILYSNYPYLFGFVTKGYYQLSGSKFLENCIFFISNNSLFFKGLYFFIKTFKSNSNSVNPILSRKIEQEKNSGIPSIFEDFRSKFGPTLPFVTSFSFQKAQVQECTVNSRFSNICKTPLFFKKRNSLFTSPLFNPLPFKSPKGGDHFHPPLGDEKGEGIKKGMKISVGNWNFQSIESILKRDEKTFSTSLNFFDFRGFSILNLYYNQLTSTPFFIPPLKGEGKGLEHLIKYLLISMLLKHQYYKKFKVPVEQKNLCFSTIQGRKVQLPNKNTVISYRIQYLKLLSLSKRIKNLIDLPLYINGKLLKKVYFKKSKTFLNTITNCKTILVEQEFNLKQSLLTVIPYSRYSAYLTLLPLSISGTLILLPPPLVCPPDIYINPSTPLGAIREDKNQNNTSFFFNVKKRNYFFYGRTIIIPSKMSTNEYFQLLKNWFSKKETNFLTLIKETSLFIRSWCVYYKIISTYFEINSNALNLKEWARPLMTLMPSSVSPTLIPPLNNNRNDLCLPNYRLGRHTDLTKYYDFLLTKLIWKKVFSLLGKTSRRFLGNQRYLNSSNNLTKILYKFFIFIKKEQLWVFIQLLPQNPKKISFLQLPAKDRENKLTNIRSKQLFLSLPRHSDFILMNHYVLSFYKSPYNFNETFYWFKLIVP